MYFNTTRVINETQKRLFSHFNGLLSLTSMDKIFESSPAVSTTWGKSRWVLILWQAARCWPNLRVTLDRMSIRRICPSRAQDTTKLSPSRGSHFAWNTLLRWPLCRATCFLPIAQSQMVTVRSSEALARRFPFSLKPRALTQP